jgi:hypothetical protein
MFRSAPIAFLRSLTAHVRRRSAVTVAPTSPQLTVEHVDDPDAAMRLVRADGLLDPESIERLIDVWAQVTAPYALHLDLFDAHIRDATTARRLESALDHLERQRIAVRVVGLDPSAISI